MKLYQLMVRPFLENGSQTLTYKKYFFRSFIIDIPNNLYKHTVFEKKLEHLQTKDTKIIKRLKSVIIVRLFSEVKPEIAGFLEVVTRKWSQYHFSSFRHRKEFLLSTKNGSNLMYLICAKNTMRQIFGIEK